MRISRVTKIRGYRVFRNFSWPADLHVFGKFNLIYGWNGCGKTTLATLFARLGKRDELTAGEVEFELELDEATKVSSADFTTADLPPIRVFNRNFIAGNIRASGSQVDPIYYLGEDSVDKQEQVKKKRENLTQANSAVTATRSEKKAADSKLDDFCISTAKQIKDLLLGSKHHANYNKSQFAKAVQALNDDSASKAMISDDEKERLPVAAFAYRSLRSRDHGRRPRCSAPVQGAFVQPGAGAPV